MRDGDSARNFGRKAGARGMRWEGLLKNKQANSGETCINIVFFFFTSVMVLHGTCKF